MLSVKSVFRVPKVTRAKEVMVMDVISVRSTVDQEKVALLALTHNLKAIPVVDGEDRLLGVVPSDTILSILYQESKEDQLLRAGVRTFRRGAVHPLAASTAVHVKQRLPWLVLGLLGGVIGALIISRFQAALAEELLLAAFIPTLVYMSGAVAMQSEIIFIHVLSGREPFTLRSYLSRELRISLFVALALCVLLSAAAYAGFQSGVLAVTVAVSLFLAVVAASVLAVLPPWVFVRLRKDPAVASGPFVTILTDLLTIVIYFSIAEFLFGVFG